MSNLVILERVARLSKKVKGSGVKSSIADVTDSFCVNLGADSHFVTFGQSCLLPYAWHRFIASHGIDGTIDSRTRHPLRCTHRVPSLALTNESISGIVLD